MASIGIDLGTTNSLVAVWRNGASVLIPNVFGEFLTPSVISLDEDGQILVGKIAKERLITHPERTTSSFKRFMGTDKEYQLGDRVFHPEDLSSFVLRQLKADAEAFLNEEVDEAVISVPAYFNDNQRTATKLAGKLAGLRVERIINEPSAASLAYRNDHQENRIFLVFDLGGGTLDVTIVETFENIIEILAVSGNNHLGGDDFNQMIAARFYGLYPELKEKLSAQQKAIILKLAEQCKIALSVNDMAGLVFSSDDERECSMMMDNNQLVQCSGQLFGQIKEVVKRALQDSHKHIDDIDEIILVGGSSKMPSVRGYIRHITGMTPLCEVDTDKAVALGAGIVSGIKMREESIRDVVLTDLCPFSLGTSVQDSITPEVYFQPIIERNSPLPCSSMKAYRTIRDFQKEVKIDILQGESHDPKENLLLGEMSLHVPPAPAGQIKIDVRFTYDINGILEVEVRQGDTEMRKVFVSNQSLSEEEVEKRLAELSVLKIHPREQEQHRLLIARAERMYEETTGPLKEDIHRQLSYFKAELEKGEPIGVKKAHALLRDYLNMVEPDDVGLLNEDVL